MHRLASVGLLRVLFDISRFAESLGLVHSLASRGLQSAVCSIPRKSLCTDLHHEA